MHKYLKRGQQFHLAVCKVYSFMHPVDHSHAFVWIRWLLTYTGDQETNTTYTDWSLRIKQQLTIRAVTTQACQKCLSIGAMTKGQRTDKPSFDSQCVDIQLHAMLYVTIEISHLFEPAVYNPSINMQVGTRTSL